MAGMKGRSGGARPNSGGKRPGAGRKPKTPAAKSANTKAPARAKKPAVEAGEDQTGLAVDGQTRDPLEFLEMVMNDPKVDVRQRVRAAIAAAQYRHTKRHDGGKKEEAEERAGKAAKGRFGVRKPPSLKVVGG